MARVEPERAPVTGEGNGLILGLMWLVVLAATVSGLHALGHGGLASPPLGSIKGLQAWLDDRDTPTAMFALIRVLALATAGYLLAITVLSLAAHVVRSPGLLRVADLATLPFARRLLASVAGLTMSATTITLAAVPLLAGRHQAPSTATALSADRDGRAANRSSGDGEVVLRRLADGGSVTMERIPRPPPRGDGTATMRVIEERSSAPHAPTPARPVVPPPLPAAPTATALGTWTIRPGDHLWHVAQAVLTEAWTRLPTEREVLAYWHDLVEVNRTHFVDPANADLIYPGQVFQLPTPPPVPAARA